MFHPPLTLTFVIHLIFSFSPPGISLIGLCLHLLLHNSTQENEHFRRPGSFDVSSICVLQTSEGTSISLFVTSSLALFSCDQKESDSDPIIWWEGAYLWQTQHRAHNYRQVNRVVAQILTKNKYCIWLTLWLTCFLPFFSSRSFVPICSSKTSSQASWSKSQSIHGERASTLPRTKPKTLNSPTVPVKPSISIFPAPELNSSPTPTALKPKPSDSLHLPASQLSDPPPSLHQLPPKPSVSPTLRFPTPRLSPSPTSLCQGMSLDGQRDKQPSPVARERRARSITISNPKTECKQIFSNEAKHDHLDETTLLDFTHPHLRRFCATTGRDSQQQSHSESQSSCSLQGKVGLSKKGNSSRDKPKPPPRNSDLSAVPKLKSNIKQLQDFWPAAATRTQTLLSESEGIHSADVVPRESQSAFDGPTAQRKCADGPQNRYKTQNAGSACNNKAYEQMRSTALPTTPKMSFSTEPHWSRSTVSPSVEARRRRFDSHNEIKMDATFPSGSNLRRPDKENNTQTVTGNSRPTLHQQTGASEHIKSPQRHRLWSKAKSQTAQMDAGSTASQSDCFTKDYSCQSRGIDQEAEASQHAHRLNRLKTCLVVPQTQEAPRPPPDERSTPQTGSCSKPDFPSQRCLLDHKRNTNHKEVTLGDMGLKQTDIFAAPDHHSVPTKLPEHPSEKCVVSWPPPVAGCQFNTNSCGGGSKRVFDLPQHRAHQRPEETTTPTTASLPSNQVDYSLEKRAFIMEEPEDPYYVTMYYPGSVYVGEYRDIQATLTRQSQ